MEWPEADWSVGRPTKCSDLQSVPFLLFSLFPPPPGYARNSSVEELDSLKRGMGTKMDCPHHQL